MGRVAPGRDRSAPERWPNLFVVGAGKAGTTSLWRFLHAHPEIFMSPVKEPNFFSCHDPSHVQSVKEERAYLRLFAGASTEKLRGEASTSYLWDPESPAAIRRASPEAKIVVSIRDPVARTYSSYWNLVRFRLERRPFLEVVRAELAGPPWTWPDVTGCVARSFYAAGIERYLDVFGENVTVLVFEEIVSDPRLELARLYSRLGVDDGFAAGLEVRVHNPFSLPRNAVAAGLIASARTRRLARRIVPLALRAPLERRLLARRPKPPIDPEAKRLLEEAFAPEHERLRALLGRELPWAQPAPG
jgi:hypothetical protein